MKQICLNGLKFQNWFGKNYLGVDTEDNLASKGKHYLILKLQVVCDGNYTEDFIFTTVK